MSERSAEECAKAAAAVNLARAAFWWGRVHLSSHLESMVGEHARYLACECLARLGHVFLSADVSPSADALATLRTNRRAFDEARRAVEELLAEHGGELPLVIWAAGIGWRDYEPVIIS